MTHARPFERTFPQTLVYGAAAMLAALAVSAVVAINGVDFFGPSSRAPQSPPGEAVLRSEASWMAQRLAQSGYIEPAVRSARMWEYQRLQQTPGPR